jgi:hypothetical protein
MLGEMELEEEDEGGERKTKNNRCYFHEEKQP